MLAQGYGKIINTASISGRVALRPQKQAAYNASNAAVISLTQTLACEWIDHDVNVNCISPGITNTTLLQVCFAMLCCPWASVTFSSRQ